MKRYSGAIARTLSVFVALTLFLAIGNYADAQAATSQLGIRPVGESGNYIDLTLDPGASRELTVELGNYGTAPVQAHTFLADVYSLVNGGMGVSLEASQGTGTSGWVDYPAQTLTLDGRSAIQRSFSLHIPPDAQPGEYLTSIVLQGEESAPASSGEGIAIRQVLRQAMAIAVTIPGPRRPALSIGSASSREVAGRTYLRIDLHNDGNVRLQPQGNLVLHDASGTEVSQYPVHMGSIYADTSAMLEVPFAGVLNPGNYTIALALSDASAGDIASTQSLPLQIAQSSAATAAPTTGTGPDLAPINQAPIQPTSAANPGVSPDVMFAGVLLLLVIAFLLPMLRRYRR